MTEINLPLKLAKPAQRALAKAGYTDINDLTNVTEEDLLNLHGMGSKALGQLKAALAEKGLTFKQ
ncbi:hypothetical protein GCM10008967_36190 [Bacillus carboniphilus]|uniref:RNA polymerase alpha subunit C-terminal domain-containing protein n=1 Tax=Bacillus carboniphilus TaxID=86663 RepID=A0ABN0WNY5_9BACI